jgi:voltage-gated potassium channel
LAIVLESHKSLLIAYNREFYLFELSSVVIFSIEYLLRIWTANIKFSELKKGKAITKQIKTPLSIIDLLAVLPFYIPMLIPFDLRFLRIARFLRILKLNRYSTALELIMRVLQRKKDILLATMYILLMTILMSSVFMYYAENSAQPEIFSSITATLWWAVATLTTVGYGDVYPVTVIGKLLATIIAITGIGIVALPTGILSSGFVEELGESSNEQICPHCNNIISACKTSDKPANRCQVKS